MKTILSLLLAINFARAEQTPDHRPAFKKKQINIANKKITVEIADDDPKRAYGLMFVKKMPQDQGMLFTFDPPEELSFWMKNTLIPLAIGYFDESGKLTDLYEMEPESMVRRDFQTYKSSGLSKYALEMNKGWFAKNKIKKGAILKP